MSKSNSRSKALMGNKNAAKLAAERSQIAATYLCYARRKSGFSQTGRRGKLAAFLRCRLGLK